jgi:hypothetical protein
MHRLSAVLLAILLFAIVVKGGAQSCRCIIERPTPLQMTGLANKAKMTPATPQTGSGKPKVVRHNFGGVVSDLIRSSAHDDRSMTSR